jgi:hypothetical protein
MLCPAGITYGDKLMGQTGMTWKLIIGTNFGVGSTGELYARSANITGTISATSGTIGKLSIGNWAHNSDYGGLTVGNGLNHRGAAYDVTEDSCGMGIAGHANGGFITIRGRISDTNWSFTSLNSTNFTYKAPKGVVELGANGLAFLTYAQNLGGTLRGSITCWDKADMRIGFPEGWAFLIGQYGFSYITD